MACCAAIAFVFGLVMVQIARGRTLLRRLHAGLRRVSGAQAPVVEDTAWERPRRSVSADSWCPAADR